MLCWLWWRVSAFYQTDWAIDTLVYLWIILLCRIVKYIGHFQRYPGDLIYMPLIPIFGWYHSIGIKLHALFTLQVTAWGSREGADKDDNHRMINLPTYADLPAKLIEEEEDGESEVEHHYYPLLPVYSAD